MKLICAKLKPIASFVLFALLTLSWASPRAMGQETSLGGWPTAGQTSQKNQTGRSQFRSDNTRDMSQDRTFGFPQQTPTLAPASYAMQPPVQMETAAANYPCGTEGGPIKYFRGIDQNGCPPSDRELNWSDEHMIPWEAFAYGEYIGPHRTPHVPTYRIRVNDELAFIYQLTREQSRSAYRLSVGDEIEILSSSDPELNQTEVRILSDGSISLLLLGQVIAANKSIGELQQELNERYSHFLKVDPAVIVRGAKTDTPLQDLRDSIDARQGQGGQAQQVRVSPDGTVQLPMIGSVPAVGLSMDELQREVNMRYRQSISGIGVTTVLTNRAARFIYVLGEVAQPGRIELTGPTSAMQALALAGGWNSGGNLRQIVVFRRDQNWGLMAIRLDLAGGLHGKQPFPSDEIWLRDSDIVLVPKMPIQRIADAVDLYFTRTLYGIFPGDFSFTGNTTL